MEGNFNHLIMPSNLILKATSGYLTNGFKGYQQLNKTSKIITSSNPAISGFLII
jgi:hypothetical protein